MNVAPEPLEYDPAGGEGSHTHTIVFLHGRGDTASNFVKSLAYYTHNSQDMHLGQIFPTFRMVFPQAIISETAAFRDKMSQWFDVWNVRDFAHNEELQAEGLRDSVGRIAKVLEQEAAKLGGRWDRIILMGISQGAATSVHTLLHLHGVPRLGAFIGFSCRMPFPGRTLAETRKVLGRDSVPDDDGEVLRNTPMLLEHCANDPLVLMEHGKALRDTLCGFGADVTWLEYPDGGHWFNTPRGIDDAVEFISKVMGVTPAKEVM